MDPFERQFNRRRVPADAVIAFVTGIVGTYLVLQLFKVNVGGIILGVLVSLIGGLWYRIRGVV